MNIAVSFMAGDRELKSDNVNSASEVVDFVQLFGLQAPDRNPVKVIQGGNSYLFSSVYSYISSNGMRVVFNFIDYEKEMERRRDEELKLEQQRNELYSSFSPSFPQGDEPSVNEEIFGVDIPIENKGN